MNRKITGAFLTAAEGLCRELSGSMEQYLFCMQGMNIRRLVPIRPALAQVMLLIFSRWRPS